MKSFSTRLSFVIWLILLMPLGLSKIPKVTPARHDSGNSKRNMISLRKEAKESHEVVYQTVGDILEEIISFDDSPNILFIAKESNNIIISTSFGKSWNEESLQELYKSQNAKGGKDLAFKLTKIIKNPYKSKEVIVLSDAKVIFRSTDYGESWKPYELPEIISSFPSQNSKNKFKTDLILNDFNDTFPIVFHQSGNDIKQHLIAGACLNKSSNDDRDCRRQFYYSADNFKSINKLTVARSCLFSATEYKLVICLTDEGSIIESTNWFQQDNKKGDKGKSITAKVVLGNKSVDQLYYFHQLFIGISATKIHLSMNGSVWSSANLNLNLDAATWKSSVNLIKSSYTNSLMLVRKLDTNNDNHMGQLMRINFNVAKNIITLHNSLDDIHRSFNGVIDYETIKDVSGAIFVNKVDNGKEIISGASTDMKLKTKISLDNGDRWTDLSAFDGEQQSINLHFAVRKSSYLNHIKKKIHSLLTPSIMMGVGNLGQNLENYSNSDTWISLNNGFNWTKALKNPHLFQFSELGSLIVAVEDSLQALDTIKFSTNYGRGWQKIHLKQKFIFKDIIKKPYDSKFVFISRNGSNEKLDIVYVDLSNVHANFGKCDVSKDFDVLYLENGSNAEERSDGYCFNGFKQKFKRKKAEHLCSSKTLFKGESLIEHEPCDCTQLDYECAVDFYPDLNGNCVTNRTDLSAGYLYEKYCDGETKSYFKPTGYMIKDGNECFADTNSGLQLDLEIEVPCKNYDDDDDKSHFEDSKNAKVKLGKLLKASKEKEEEKVAQAWNIKFDGLVMKYNYLLRSENRKNFEDDEVIIVLTSDLKAYISFNHGITWQEIAPSEEISNYIVDLANGRISLLSANNKIIYSHNNGYSWRSFLSPVVINNADVTRFKVEYNVEKRNWVIFTGVIEDRLISYISTDLGATWAVLQDNVMVGCMFAGNYLHNSNEKNVDENLIYCPHYQPNGEASLSTSTDFFGTQKQALENLTTFWVDHKNILIGVTERSKDETNAVGKDKGEFDINVSYDGKSWKVLSLPSRAHFRASQKLLFDLKSEGDSQGSNRKDLQFFIMNDNTNGSTVHFGDVYKSNSQGDKFTLMASDIDYNQYKADFEKAFNLEGIIIINSVLNTNMFINDKNHNRHQLTRKILQSKITFDDGGQWDYITPPQKDSRGKKYACIGKPKKECALHLFGKASGKKNKFSSQSAAGVLIGVGNVGDSLGMYKDANTFITTDAGVTWKEIMKGPYQFGFGDKGSLFVLINDKNPTNQLRYSVDNGDTWKTFNFTTTPKRIYDFTTVQTDSSKKFLLFGVDVSDYSEDIQQGGSSKVKSELFPVDFSKLLSKKCKFDPYIGLSDFEIWSPSHPKAKGSHAKDSKKCIFGAEYEFYRKKPKSVCFIGDSIPQNGKVLSRCECTEYDYECDINYFKNDHNNGKCEIIPELRSVIEKQYSEFCGEMIDVLEYQLPSGYRKTSISQCQSGLNLDASTSRACPGKQKEYRDKHRGLHGLRLFFMIALVLSGATIVSYIGLKFLYLLQTHGQIRLGDTGTEVSEMLYWAQNNVPVKTVIKRDILKAAARLIGLGRDLYVMVKELVQESNSRIRLSDDRRARTYRRVFQNNLDDDELAEFAIYDETFDDDAEQLSNFRNRNPQDGENNERYVWH